MAKPGDRVRLHLEGKEVDGVLMPSEGGTLFIKRADGYNQGFQRSRIKKIALLRQKAKPPKKKAPAQKKRSKRIVVLHTGGTIASRVDYETGGVVAQVSEEELLAQVPELGAIARIETVQAMNVMSEDMRIEGYTELVKRIEKHLDADGVIVAHGTDTLHYTAAALAFALENAAKPVLLVGSQRSPDRGSSDAAMNLRCAAQFIARTDFAGVAICMHHHSADDVCAILPPTRTRKMHTSRRDAFKAIGVEPYALVDVRGKVEKVADWGSPKGDLVARAGFEGDVAMIIAHPNLSPDVLKTALKAKGVIIQGTGLGHMPVSGRNESLLEAVEAAVKGGCVVAMTSQCLFGRTHDAVYRNLRRLRDAGVVFCEDMLPETAFVKLCWLLANEKKRAKEMLPKDLRGEITDRTMYGEEFL